MTVSNYSIGNLHTYGFASSKNWLGGDGKYTSPTKPRKLKWNSYQMTHRINRIYGKVVPGGTGWCSIRSINALGNPVVSDATSQYATWLNNAINPVWTFAHGQTMFNTYWSSRDQTKLLAKLLSKSKGGTNYNVGVSLAEVDKFASSTIGLIKNMSFGAVDLYNGQFAKFARRFGSGPPHPTKVKKLSLMDIPARFLGMSYCWLPAYHDLHSAALAFEEISRGPRKKIFEVSRTIHNQQVDVSTLKFPVREFEITQRITYEMYEEMSIFRQMGLGNPASILWERIPGSFLWDWFIPIGTYLELIGQIPFMKGRFMQSSMFRQTVSGTPTGKPVGHRSCVFSGDVQSTNFWYLRNVSTSLSVPFPSFQVSGAVQGRRINNAVALGSLMFDRVVQSYLGRAGKPRGYGVNPNLNTDRKIVEWSKSLLLI